MGRRKILLRALAFVGLVGGSACVVSVASAANCIDYLDYLHKVGELDTPGGAVGIAISGDYAYVADGLSGLSVINISSPSVPQYITSLAGTRSPSA
jgi:hypothetical protein